MSLFTHEEVCDGCRHANWHEPCAACYERHRRFCSCEIDVAELVNCYRGTCAFREPPAKGEGDEHGE